MPLLSKNTPKDGIKLAPPIKNISVLSYERHADQRLWYIIKVTPQQAGTPNQQLSGNNQCTETTRPSLKRKPYLIARRFDQFCTFDQHLHADFSTSLLAAIRPRRPSQHSSTSHTHTLPMERADNELPKLKLQRKILPSKNIHSERQHELQRYCQELLKLHTQITQSLLMLEFFGLHKADTERIVYSSLACLSASRLSYISPQRPTPQLMTTTPTTRATNSTNSANPTNSASPVPTSASSIVSRRVRSSRQDEDTDASHRSVKKAKSQPNMINHSASSIWALLPPSPPPLPPLMITYDDANISYYYQGKSSPSQHISPPSSAIWFTSTLPTSSSMSSSSSSAAESTPPPSPSILSPSKGTLTTVHASSVLGDTSETAYESKQLNIRHLDSPLTFSDVSRSDSPVASKKGAIYSDDNDAGTGGDDGGEYLLHHSAVESLGLPNSTMTLGSLSEDASYIKLKVVYDLDNIIMLQVPRSIRLPELRARILHKFEDTATDLPVDFKLVFNSLAPGGRKDSLLSFSAAYSTYANLDARTIIATQDDLIEAMSRWNGLTKVSVRCVVN